MLPGLAVMMCLGLPASAATADPAESDPTLYQVVFENERVRVLRYHDRPGDRTSMHHHPDFVLLALGPFRRRLTFPDGTIRERAFRAGEVAWNGAQSHAGENIGDTDTDVLIVELKGEASPR